VGIGEKGHPLLHIREKLRERNYFWRSKPGEMLVISIVGVIIAFTLLEITGFIVEPTSANAVFSSLAYSTIFTISIDPIKVLVFKKTGLISQ
jgi:hypothetical protein